jgi:hypothetical protein
MRIKMKPRIEKTKRQIFAEEVGETIWNFFRFRYVYFLVCGYFP